MTSHILIIEDEPSIADTICYALKNENFEVTWKSLGQEALSVLKSQKIDLIILDVGLPDMTGFEVCKQMREFTDIPIIFLTARKEEIDRVIGLEIGGDAKRRSNAFKILLTDYWYHLKISPRKNPLNYSTNFGILFAIPFIYIVMILWNGHFF